ncbi:hypothetical protein HZA86_05435 [Candidatus Uhrbacteria bacterium]|nr:hypothetical protein [Candidatus Uhrbacteria bacterium]
MLSAARRTGCHKVLIFVHSGSQGQHDAEQLAGLAGSVHIDLGADPDHAVEEINEHLQRLVHPEPVRRVPASERQGVN